MPEQERIYKPKSIDECVEFMGLNIVPSSVKNPHLRRVIEKTAKGGFRFMYDDHSRKKWDKYGDYSDVKPKYHERVHSDYSCGNPNTA